MSQKNKPGFRKYEDALDRRANKAHKIYMRQQKESQLTPRIKNGKLDISSTEEYSSEFSDMMDDIRDDLWMDHQ